MGRNPLSLVELMKTQAFIMRDKNWPCIDWDYTEWEECLLEAEEELNNEYV